MASRSQNARQAEARVQRWNQLHPVGTPVIVTAHDSTDSPGTTTSPARVLPSYGMRRAVIDVDGKQTPLLQVSATITAMHAVAVSIEGAGSAQVYAPGRTPAEARGNAVRQWGAVFATDRLAAVAVGV